MNSLPPGLLELGAALLVAILIAIVAPKVDWKKNFDCGKNDNQ